MTRRVWFASWRCNCTILALAAAEISSLCPAHGALLLGREQVEVAKSLPLGVVAAPDGRPRQVELFEVSP